tara:strand:- start:519 stop:1286 length:768 start_codon:yes stop_codon:yes gene_type:complete
MHEPTIGSQDWLYNLYADFWNEGDSGLQPTAYDFEQGYMIGNPMEVDILTSVGQGQLGPFNYEWTDSNDNTQYTPMQQWNENAGIYEVGTILNLDQWLAEWDQYIPKYNMQNAQDAYDIGLLEKDKAVADVFRKGRNSEKYLFDVLYSQDDYDTMYDTALGVGRLSDFKNLANINQMENQYAADVYNTLGDLGSMGAFTPGAINEDVYQTTVGGGWGDAAIADNMDFCEQQCADLSGASYALCMSSCAATGSGGG